ncbi:peptidase inhibitor family I36 protein [Streptomyces sp. PvR034]|uniref:peptidase inhibitor family I36 protein n=1 Tax=Streptomyces sp. PvR034 TaxID=3156401 RepID=UPI003397505E
MRIKIGRAAGLGLAAATMMATALVAAPSAAASASDCPRGYVCVWSNSQFSGGPTWKSQGNLSGMWSGNGMSIKNNGWYQPGADHIHWGGHWSDGRRDSGCLHFPNDPSTYTIGGNFTLDYANWGPEC